MAVKNSSGDTIASYSYNGLGQRITQTDGGTTTDLYYSAADQVLEEDVGGQVQAQNVWSPVYVNALVLRDQSSESNGVLDQRLYVVQDANWNVTALVDTSGQRGRALCLRALRHGDGAESGLDDARQQRLRDAVSVARGALRRRRWACTIP